MPPEGRLRWASIACPPARFEPCRQLAVVSPIGSRQPPLAASSLCSPHCHHPLSRCPPPPPPPSAAPLQVCRQLKRCDSHALHRCTAGRILPQRQHVELLRVPHRHVPAQLWSGRVPGLPPWFLEWQNRAVCVQHLLPGELFLNSLAQPSALCSMRMFSPGRHVRHVHVRVECRVTDALRTCNFLATRDTTAMGLELSFASLVLR